MTALFPFEITRLSVVFLTSIFMAVSVPVILIGATGDYAAITGGAINLGVMYAGMAIFSFQVAGENTGIMIFAVVCVVLTVVCAALWYWTRNFAFQDDMLMPRLVRYSFALFAIVLFVVGTALVLKRPNIFPWGLSTELSVLYGWIFLGAMIYFIYGFFKPYWGNARGQLSGFLVYDLVLIIPYIRHFSTVPDELRLNLIIYVLVLVYSGVLALYYLLFNTETRLPFRPF